ncbi:hypothetical protein [Neisseria meningitidis]|nr:hypothetical protein [Neisseria meningitidis]
MIKDVNGKYRLAPEKHDFKMNSFGGGEKSNVKTIFRNMETIIGSPG